MKSKVKVRLGVFTKEGCVFGKVYMDCSGNNQQDEGEVGVPGVVLVMQDGTSITTDVNGQYSLCGDTRARYGRRSGPGVEV